MSACFSAVGGARAAHVLVADHFCVKPGECVLITADTASDFDVVDAIMAAAAALGAKPTLTVIPQLPFQGALADPHIPDPIAEAVLHTDVWFDLTFPYMAGSHAHDRAMKAGRARYLLLGDLKAASLQRLYGTLPLDRIFEIQTAFDEFVASQEGARCRITSPSGTDVSFTLAKTVTKKLRRTDQPGTFTPMGAGIFYPDVDSVNGEIAVDAVFHETYVVLKTPMRLVIDGRIREVRDGGTQTQAMDRALRRASRGELGRVIHFSYGFHPALHFSGASFIEDIRTTGASAIGLGQPWWEPGGGENHPDAVMSTQSLWIGGEQVVRDGVLVGPPQLAEAARQMRSSL